jgi:transcriptional regulator with XRE-family HTH domain
MVFVKIGHLEGRKEFCCNAAEIISEAEQQHLTRSEIAEICKVDPVTIANWKRRGTATPKAIRHLADFLNARNVGERGAVTSNIASTYPPEILLRDATIEQLVVRIFEINFDRFAKRAEGGV